MLCWPAAMSLSAAVFRVVLQLWSQDGQVPGNSGTTPHLPRNKAATRAWIAGWPRLCNWIGETIFFNSLDARRLFFLGSTAFFIASRYTIKAYPF